MRIIDVFHIKGRGPVATVTWESVELPRAGDQLRRADGSYWTIRGVERHAINRSSWVGAPLGLLLSAETTITKGDDVEVWRQ